MHGNSYQTFVVPNLIGKFFGKFFGQKIADFFLFIASIDYKSSETHILQLDPITRSNRGMIYKKKQKKKNKKKKMIENSTVPRVHKNREFTKFHLHFVLGPIYSVKQIISLLFNLLLFAYHEYLVFCQKIFAFGDSG